MRFQSLGRCLELIRNPEENEASVRAADRFRKGSNQADASIQDLPRFLEEVFACQRYTDIVASISNAKHLSRFVSPAEMLPLLR